MTNQPALSLKQIIMYATETCADCKSAKAFFEAHDIQFTRVNLEGNAEATEFVMQINHGNRSVPTILFPDGSVLVEPSWQELRHKLFKS